MATSGRQRSNRSANGTVIITGANGSLGLAYVQQFLQDFPSYFAIFAVRNDSDEDPNTAKLRQIASKFKDAKFSVEAVDLSSIKNVKAFSENIANRVSSGEIPQISAIVCNAFNWSLTGQKMSGDGMDLAFEVSQLSHYILVLKLLGSMNKSTGRIVMLGSDAHDSNNKNSMNPLGAQLPSNLEQLVHPTADKPGEEQARGFQRYANSKLANIMFMHALNRKLQNASVSFW
jgi:NAD(P)-dependent dehydrogenase (short-subunit alcohol dehydrogenase family)